MIEWSTILAALKVWVVAGTGVPANCVVYYNEKRPFTARRFITLELTQINNAGSMDTCTPEDYTIPGSDPVEVIVAQRITGQRQFVVRISVWSNDQTPAQFASNLLELLVILSGTPRMRNPLASCKVALSSFSERLNSDEEVDQHIFSVWTTLATFNGSFEYLDTFNSSEHGIIENLNAEYELPTGSDAKELSVTTE